MKHQSQTVRSAARGPLMGRGWPQGVDIWTATTEGTATTAWIKGLRVLSLSSVAEKAGTNSVRGTAGPCGLRPGWLRAVDIWTATTEGTATTAWIKGFACRSPSKTLRATEGKSLQGRAGRAFHRPGRRKKPGFAGLFWFAEGWSKVKPPPGLGCWLRPPAVVGSWLGFPLDSASSKPPSLRCAGLLLVIRVRPPCGHPARC